MANILVVDDSAVDRMLAGRLLQQDSRFAVTFAENGREALAEVRRHSPDVIVCDLQMPEMNGLELVAAVREEFPSIPVVLMTNRGSEEIAAEALRRGAASYVPKVRLADHLCDTVGRILKAADADRMHSRLMHSLEQCDSRFRLRNDPELIEALVSHIQEMLCCVPLGDESERLRVGVAVKHALWIAHHHGNLEIPLNGERTDDDFQTLANERRHQAPYYSRSLTVSIHISTSETIFKIGHDGPGIDVSQLPPQLETAAVDRSWLGGFVLIPSVMDDVRYDDSGRTLCLLHKAATNDEAELEWE